MPYRRLPKTDQTRLKALQAAVNSASEADFGQQVIPYHLLTEAQRLLMNFENQVQQYQSNRLTKVNANKKYRHDVQQARMYISHFIQVLNMSVMRGEIKKEHKKLYKLDPDSQILPDLYTDEDLLLWGANIIEGEAARQRMGGFPLYNPSINKVKVFYDIFKEQQFSQNMHRRNNARAVTDMTELRQLTDALILEIWNLVEEKYQNLLPYERLQACKKYGVIYYYRKGEKRLTPESDKAIIRNREQQPELGI